MPISLNSKLAILQQSEYEWARYSQWLKINKDSSLEIQPKQWTLKLKLLSFGARFFSLQITLLFLNSVQKIAILGYVFLATIKLRLLQQQGLIVIAIAGSYGKTSTKYIAHHVLSGDREVLMTPDSINTPIGIARFIITSLHASHVIFLAELGEYYPGDIARLVRFLRPDYKILTPVGFAHLERFGSQERLNQALRELTTTQPQRGKLFIYGEDYNEKQISNVHVSRAGTEFDFQRASFFIPLLGKHNAINTLPALWLAGQFEIKHVRERLTTLPFIPHRLEPTQLEHNILLLDNGYNANPASSVKTLAVLKALDSPQKIVFTPGYIEMGILQQKENENLGRLIAEVADLCVIIKGVNTTTIEKGLLIGGMHKSDIIFAQSEQDGMTKITGRIKPCAIILFENSIPELYKR